MGFKIFSDMFSAEVDTW